MIIRQEEERDYNKVYELVEAAFKEAEHTDGREQDLVERLRKAPSFVKELSLVAEVEDKLVGHILFSEVKVDDFTLLALAPVSVLPEYKNKGIGKELISRGHEVARELGYKGIVLLGYPEYYSKFGYITSTKYDIKSSFEVPDEFFMAIQLEDGSLDLVDGVVVFPKEFA